MKIKQNHEAGKVYTTQTGNFNNEKPVGTVQKIKGGVKHIKDGFSQSKTAKKLKILGKDTAKLFGKKIPGKLKGYGEAVSHHLQYGNGSGLMGRGDVIFCESMFGFAIGMWLGAAAVVSLGVLGTVAAGPVLFGVVAASAAVPPVAHGIGKLYNYWKNIDTEQSAGK